MAGSAGMLNVFLGLNNTQFITKMQASQMQMGRFKKTGSAAMSGFSKNAALALGAVAIASVKMGADLETSLTKMQTLVGLSAATVEGFKETIMEVSSDTGQSAIALSDAMFVVTSAGLRGAKAQEVLTQAAQASRVGLGETTEIARALTGVLQAYEAQGLTAARATEILMATVEQGNLNAADLAPTLGRVVGIAGQMGVTFEEVGASVATFTRLGVQADEAVVGLRQIMTSILKPTTQAHQALAQYGLTIEDVRKSIANQGLQQTLADLLEMFGENQDGVAALFGNVRALSAVYGTAAAQGETYAEVLRQVTEDHDRLNRAVEITSGTLNDKWNKLTNDAQNAALLLGDGLKWVFTQLYELNQQAFTPYIKNLEDAKKATDDLTSSTRDYADAISMAHSASKEEEPVLKAKRKTLESMEKMEKKSADQIPHTNKELEKLRKTERDYYEERQTYRDSLEEDPTRWEKSVAAMNKAQATLSGFSSIASQLGTVMNINHQNRLADLEALEKREQQSLKARYGNSADFAERQEALNQKQEARRKKMQKEYADQQKALATFQAIVLGAQAVISAYATPPAPVGIALGTLMAGLVAGQVAVINGAQIPAFKNFGVMGTPGTALVGERGPEMVHLPAGARVGPASGGGTLGAAFDREDMLVWLDDGERHHKFRTGNLR